MPGWWLADLNPKGLSQGEVIGLVISGTAAVPLVSLTPTQMRGGKDGFAVSQWKTDGNGVGRYLASGKMLPCLVVSHSCDIEKPRANSRVLVAPMKPLSSFSHDVRENVLQQGSIKLFAVTEIPGMEDHCADFRCISYLDRTMHYGKRVASMSLEGVKNLQARLVSFFTRLKAPPGHFSPEV